MGSIVCVPCGWVLMEKVGAAQLHYSIRKSLFWDTPATKACYSDLEDLRDASGLSPGKTATVLSLFS